MSALVGLGLSNGRRDHVDPVSRLLSGLLQEAICQRKKSEQAFIKAVWSLLAVATMMMGQSLALPFNSLSALLTP